MAATASTIRPVPESQIAVQAAAVESSSARLPAEDTRNIDRRCKLRRPESKKNSPVLRVDRKYHMGRTDENYQAYIA